jgi:hypothetical protein
MKLPREGIIGIAWEGKEEARLDRHKLCEGSAVLLIPLEHSNGNCY